MTVAIYPGTFDPVHYGHLDIAQRAASLFDKVVIGVYDRPNKAPLFTLEERLNMFRQAVPSAGRISVQSYSGLTVAFANRNGARVIIRGLRATFDFEYEYQMALTNRKLSPDVDTVCLVTSLDHAFISSTIVKDIARAGGSVDCMVPAHVSRALGERLCARDGSTAGKKGG